MPTVNISKLNIQITGNAQGLATAVGQANKSLSQLGNQTATVGQRVQSSFAELDKILLRTAAIYGIFKTINFAQDLVTSSVRLAADAEQAQISFEVLTGSAETASTTISDLYKFVETTPFRLEEVRNAAQMLTGAGIEGEKLIPTLRAIGDVAAGTGKAFGELAYLYATTRTEQRLYTKDLNQFLAANVPLIPVLAMQFGRAEESVRKLAEEGKLSFGDLENAFAAMTSEGGKFFNLTQRQSQTTAGEYSNFLDEVDALKREFGVGLLPTLRDVVAMLRLMIGGGDDSSETLDNLRASGEALGDVLRIVGGSIVFVQTGLNALVQKVIQTYAPVAKLYDLVSGTNLSDFFTTFDQQQTQNILDLIELRRRLFDLDSPLIDRTGVAQANDGFKTLSETIQSVGNDSIKARNALKALTQDANTFADDIRKKYASPIEEFEAAVRRIIQANLLGALADNFATRAIREEVEKLYSATEKLRDLLTSNPAIEAGSQADILARFQARFKQPDINGQVIDRNAIQGIIDKIQAELNGQVNSLNALANAADAAAESLLKVAETGRNARQGQVQSLLVGVNQSISELESLVKTLRLQIQRQPDGPGLLEELFFGQDRTPENLRMAEASLEAARRMAQELQAEVAAMNALRESTEELRNTVSGGASPGSTSPPLVVSPTVQTAPETNLEMDRLLARLNGAIRALESGDSNSPRKFFNAASRELQGVETREQLDEVVRAIREGQSRLPPGQQAGLQKLIDRMEKRIEKQQQDTDRTARLNRTILNQIATNTSRLNANPITVIQYSA